MAGFQTQLARNLCETDIKWEELDTHLEEANIERPTEAALARKS